MIEKIKQLLRDGIPRFESEILKALDLEHSNANIVNAYYLGHLSRSDKPFVIEGEDYSTRAYAYSSAENSGKVMEWKSQGKDFSARFAVKRENNKQETARQTILHALEKSKIALFADEIWTESKKLLDRKIELPTVKSRLTDLYRKGKVSRLDKTKGWKFARGYLYALNTKQIEERLAITDGQLSVYSDMEMGIAKNIENAVKRASDIRDELGFDKTLITWLSKKLGKESEYKVKSVGTGQNYTIELEKKTDELKGNGLIPWLRYIKVGNEVIFYDDRLPFEAIEGKVKTIAYWLTEEGKRRQQIGLAWEDFSKKLFGTIDRKHEWQLSVLEHRERWRGQSGKEFDHIYVCRLGPKEFGITLYVVIECKAGILTNEMVEEFWRKVINEPMFRNFEDGGLKTNTLLILMIGRTIENKTVLEKCRRKGIRVVFRVAMQDTFLRLTGQKIDYDKILREIRPE